MYDQTDMRSLLAFCYMGMADRLRDTLYEVSTTQKPYKKSKLSSKQVNARKKSKLAKRSRKQNR